MLVREMSEERLITLAEVKELLEEEAKSRPQLSHEQKIALDHASKFAKLSVADAKALLEELRQMGFISDPIAYRIVDICPTYPEEVRAIFAKERLILEKKQIDQIITAVKKRI
ncbi:MAG: RNA polymerase Rpb4 family protein [Methanomassiliicoccales archaeon]